MNETKELWSLDRAIQELFSSSESITKDKVLTVRVEESLYSLIEAYAEKLGTDSVAKTVRTIVSWFFLPEVYKFELENLKPEKLAEVLSERIEAGEKVSFDRLILFVKQLKKYSLFVEEAYMRSELSLQFIEQEVERVEQAVSMLEGAEETWKKLFEEKKEKK